MIPGKTVRLGGAEYVIPPLNLKSLKLLDEKIQKVTDKSTSTKEQLELICVVALAAMQRNYPDVTMDFMEEWVDLANCFSIFSAILGQSGYAESKPGEEKASA